MDPIRVDWADGSVRHVTGWWHSHITSDSTGGCSPIQDAGCTRTSARSTSVLRTTRSRPPPPGRIRGTAQHHEQAVPRDVSSHQARSTRPTPTCRTSTGPERTGPSPTPPRLWPPRAASPVPRLLWPPSRFLCPVNTVPFMKSTVRAGRPRPAAARAAPFPHLRRQPRPALLRACRTRTKGTSAVVTAAPFSAAGGAGLPGPRRRRSASSAPRAALEHHRARLHERAAAVLANLHHPTSKR